MHDANPNTSFQKHKEEGDQCVGKNQSSNESITGGLAKNPHFGSVSRAPYHLGYLLSEMPARNPLTPETYLMAEAARQHADNGTTALLYGVGAIGSLMIGAGIAEQDGNYEIPKGDLTALGELIQHIAVELQFLREVEGYLTDDLAMYAQQKTKGGL